MYASCCTLGMPWSFLYGLQPACEARRGRVLQSCCLRVVSIFLHVASDRCRLRLAYVVYLTLRVLTRRAACGDGRGDRSVLDVFALATAVRRHCARHISWSVEAKA